MEAGLTALVDLLLLFLYDVISNMAVSLIFPSGLESGQYMGYTGKLGT